jgi:hypothetical protein
MKPEQNPVGVFRRDVWTTIETDPAHPFCHKAGVLARRHRFIATATAREQIVA